MGSDTPEPKLRFSLREILQRPPELLPGYESRTVDAVTQAPQITDIRGVAWQHDPDPPEDVAEALAEWTCDERCLWVTRRPNGCDVWLAAPMPCPHRSLWVDTVEIGGARYCWNPWDRRDARPCRRATRLEDGELHIGDYYVIVADLVEAARAVGAPDADVIMWWEDGAKLVQEVSTIADWAQLRLAADRKAAQLHQPKASSDWRRTMRMAHAYYRRLTDELGIDPTTFYAVAAEEVGTSDAAEMIEAAARWYETNVLGEDRSEMTDATAAAEIDRILGS